MYDTAFDIELRVVYVHVDWEQPETFTSILIVVLIGINSSL